ncbi:MAG: chemotaxis protein CheW [Treponema sp.]|nr:chemotaxis protein CheW [Treponema sp.]
MEATVATQVIEKVETISKAQVNQENATFIDFKMVTFSLAEKDYAIDIMHVKEIAKAGRFTYVPNTLPFVLGVYNLRGEIIPILDLRLFFNIPVPKRTGNKLENLLILNVDDQKFGLVVDKIDKVVGVQKSTIQPPHPLFGDINIKYIDGIVEAANRLYVLLDVLKIFAAKETKEHSSADKSNIEPSKDDKYAALKLNMAKAAAQARDEKQKNSAQPAPKEAKSEELEKAALNIKFISETLANYKKFFVSNVNESWVNHRYKEWEKEKGADKTQLQNENDADSFLKPFWSQFSGTWWSKEFAQSIKQLLPENSAKQIIVWNPGCGKGMETYSLACVLKEKYPNSRIRIYAQDIDLLSVSNASLMSVPAKLADDWYGPYLSKKANGELVFNEEIKESVMFEYHDCKNANALPMVDIVFARDLLSLVDQDAQKLLINEFLEKMKGNAVVIVGENEAIQSSYGFGEKSVGALVAYTKD